MMRQVRRRRARHRQSVRRRTDRDPRHHLGAGAHAGWHHRLPVLHPDRRCDQSGQLRRRAGRIITGKLVGINTAIFSRSGGSQGIGFAIPANMVRVVVASAKGGSTEVKRPWLGAQLQAVTPEIAGDARPEASDRCARRRASVASKSPADRARAEDAATLIVCDRGSTDRGSQRVRLSLRARGRWAVPRRSTCSAAANEAHVSLRSRWRRRRTPAAMRIVDQGTFAVPGRQGRQPVAGARRRIAARQPRPRASSSLGISGGCAGSQRLGFQQRRRRTADQRQARSERRKELEKVTRDQNRAGRSPSCAAASQVDGTLGG